MRELESRSQTSLVRSVPVLYGIPNCEQVKNARRWLDAHGVAYRFHDFRKDGIDAQRLDRWLMQRDWEALVNRKGTTWRRLAEDARPSDREGAVASMLAAPSLIKRPVLEIDGGNDTGSSALLEVGFSDARYRDIFATDG